MTGEYDCCAHCAPIEGGFDSHVVDPPPHRSPCPEGCNDGE